MTTLFARAYDILATGFYFETYEQYIAAAEKAVNDYGQRVEEFEIQFIDGEDIDCELAKSRRAASRQLRPLSSMGGGMGRSRKNQLHYRRR